MDPAVPAFVVALLPLAGVLVGALLQYGFGQRSEARKQLRTLRAEAYADFFRAVAALAQGQAPERLAAAADAKVRVCMYGSPAVVDRLDAFVKAGAVATEPEGQAALMLLLEAMRGDVVGGRLGVAREVLSSINFSR